MRKLALSIMAILGVLLLWAVIRLAFPGLTYTPPDVLAQALSPSVFVQSDSQKIVMFAYVTVALVLLFLFFTAIQNRLTGKRGLNGLFFGAALGVLWSLGFLTAVVFLESPLYVELQNGLVDLIPLALAGWLAGLILEPDRARAATPASFSLLAISVIGIAYAAIHSVTLLLFDDPTGVLARLALTPTTAGSYLMLTAIGAWAGTMYVVFRPGMPFKSVWANSGFFAAGIFGHSWVWFHMFFNILYADVLLITIGMGVVDILGIFVGVVAYEHLLRRKHRFQKPR